MQVRNQRLSDEEFFREREQVLSEWPVGKDIDLDEAVEYHKSLPAAKNFVLKLIEAKTSGINC